MDGTDAPGKKWAPAWRVLRWPTLIWIMLGFLLSYLLFFIRPIFANSAQVMMFPAYVPAIKPIGVDLAQMLSYSRSWLIARQTPYIGSNLYPPLTAALFSPLLIPPFPLAYWIVTLGTITSFAFSSLVFPILVSTERRLSPLVMLLFVTGLLSYGFQFELERGQFNVIAVALSLLAVYLFHHKPRLRLLSYALFSLSVQLKIYPAIFIVMLVDDWASWKKQVPRLVGILAFNVGCLFALGPSTFLDFVAAAKSQMAKPYIWVGNHSVVSFASQLSPANPQPIELALLLLFALCFLLAMYLCSIRRLSGLNPYLLLTCAIGALLIPSVSHDYKLPILVAPVLLFMDAVQLHATERLRSLLRILMLVLMSVAYSSILFSYTNKVALPKMGAFLPSLYTQNNLPAILLMGLAATSLVILDHGAGTSVLRGEPLKTTT